jgi:spermidine synthase
VLTVDYLGALVASVIFPSILLPRLGIHQTSLAFGALNALVALLGTALFPLPREVAFRLRASGAIVLVGLGFTGLWLSDLVEASEQQYFGAPIVHVSQSPYQRVVVTRSPRTTRLFLNGNLQFSSDDEYRYHEALVHPAVAALGHAPRRALVLGGGDGLAARELLRYPELERIDLVDLDPEMTRLFRDHELGRSLNGGSLADPRVVVHNEDAFVWLDRDRGEAYELCVVDFPDPSGYAVGKLYTDAFYGMLRERVGMQGVVVVQATSPGYARKTFWTIVTTIESAGFSTQPYHAYVPSFGDWGFVLAGGPRLRRPERLAIATDTLRFLDDRVLATLFEMPRDRARVEAPVSRLNDQKLVPIYTEEWGEWAR